MTKKRNIAAFVFATVSAWIMVIVGQPDLFSKGLFHSNTEAVLLYAVIGPMITCAIAEGAWSFMAIPLPTLVVVIGAFNHTVSLHPGKDFYDVLLGYSWISVAVMGFLLGALGCFLGFALKFAGGAIMKMVSRITGTRDQGESAAKTVDDATAGASNLQVAGLGLGSAVVSAAALSIGWFAIQAVIILIALCLLPRSLLQAMSFTMITLGLPVMAAVVWFISALLSSHVISRRLIPRWTGHPLPPCHGAAAQGCLLGTLIQSARVLGMAAVFTELDRIVAWPVFVLDPVAAMLLRNVAPAQWWMWRGDLVAAFWVAPVIFVMTGMAFMKGSRQR